MISETSGIKTKKTVFMSSESKKDNEKYLGKSWLKTS